MLSALWRLSMRIISVVSNKDRVKERERVGACFVSRVRATGFDTRVKLYERTHCLFIGLSMRAVF
jgi:hypothetical protein